MLCRTHSFINNWLEQFAIIDDTLRLLFGPDLQDVL
jgi:hypothetical protein